MDHVADGMLCATRVIWTGAIERLVGEVSGRVHRIRRSRRGEPSIALAAVAISALPTIGAQSEMAQYLAAPANVEPREKALVTIRDILTELEKLEDDLAQRQPLAARGGSQGDKQAPSQQLAALAVDAGLLRCEALLLRTRLYPRGSEDRIASATEVDRQATAILQRTEPDWASRPQLQVAAATARLDLGQSEESALRTRATCDQCQSSIGASWSRSGRNRPFCQWHDT